MSIRPVSGEADGEDWHFGEVLRAIQRVEDSVTRMEGRMVERSVYDVERVAMESQVATLAMRVSEDRMEARAALQKENTERENWQRGLVSRIWWLAGSLVPIVLTTVGLVVAVVSLLTKG